MLELVGPEVLLEAVSNLCSVIRVLLVILT